MKTTHIQLFEDFKHEENLSNIKQGIISYVEKNSNFDLENESDNFLSFGTREHGNVYDEEAGEEDIMAAYKIKKYIINIFNIDSNKIEVEVVDEWVMLNINL